MLFPSIEESDLFDDTFSQDLYEFARGENKDGDDEYGHSDAGLDRDSPNFDPYCLPGLNVPAKQEHSPPQPWRKRLWCPKRRSSRLVVEKTRKTGLDLSGTISASHLVSDDNCTVRRPRTAHGTPSRRSTKRGATSPKASNSPRVPDAQIPFPRKVTLSPSPVYTRLLTRGKMDHIDTWQQDFQNFHLHLPHDRCPSTPQTSTRPPGYESTTGPMARAVMAHQAGIEVPASTIHQRKLYQSIGGEYHPAIDPRVLDPTAVAGLNVTASLGGQLPSLSGQFPSYEQPPIPVWATESRHSSYDSHQSHDSQRHMTHAMRCNDHVQPWSSSPRSSSQASFPILWQDYYPGFMAPEPEHFPHDILEQHTGTAQNGLSIQCPELEPRNQAVRQEPRAFHHTVSSGTAIPYSLASVPAPDSLDPYPPLPPPAVSPFTTPHKQRRFPPRSPSPSSSLTKTTLHIQRQRSPTRTDHNRTRLKSIHKPGPMKDTSSSYSPLPNAFSVRSSSKPPRTPKTPSNKTLAAGGGVGTIDFVNFTPDDSIKLLSDVAPSGSSKTRARREAEAREKRKRLSEAALKAVRSAGGDLAVLEKALLT